MTERVKQEMTQFSMWQKPLEGVGYKVAQPLPLTWSLNDDGKSPRLLILCLVHGNEVGGLAVVNEILRLLAGGYIRAEIPLLFVLANPDAAVKGQRFLQENLNRCFGLKVPKGVESQRAIAIGSLFRPTDYMVDLHQTSGPSDRSFFIFPFSPRPVRFASGVDPSKTMVTHWGPSFSKEGACSDEYLNSLGGCGITLELGQMGFDPYQVNDGVAGILRALFLVSRLARKETHPDLSDLHGLHAGELYTFAHVEEVASGVKSVALVPGWQNFSNIKQGDLVGRIDGMERHCQQNGKIMFPFYANPHLPYSVPKEAWRILKPLAWNELPWK